MQNATDVKTETTQEDKAKPGKYEFLISGILTKDANGYPLKAKNGNSYSKVKFILLDGEKRHYVYHLVFGTQDIKQIVSGVGNPALTHVYQLDEKGFDLETLCGESGMLLLGFNKAGYPTIECFIKPKAFSNAQVAERRASNESGESFRQELDKADNVPF